MITLQKKLVKAGKDVKTVEADTLIREYKQKRWVPNSDRISKPDSLSAWYSIEEMENFLALAKSHGGDGIKFYYGAYPEDYSTKPEYAGRQTLVMVGTKSKLTEMGAIANKDIYYSHKWPNKNFERYNSTRIVLLHVIRLLKEEWGTLGLLLLIKE